MSPKIAILAKKTQTKPDQKPNQTNHSKQLGLSYFCELRPHAKFWLPRSCLGCISMVKEEKIRKELAVLEAALAHLKLS